jgi:hypothetical protein
MVFEKFWGLDRKAVHYHESSLKGWHYYKT